MITSRERAERQTRHSQDVQLHSVPMWLALQELLKPRKEVRKLQLLYSGKTLEETRLILVTQVVNISEEVMLQAKQCSQVDKVDMVMHAGASVRQKL